MKFGFAVCLLGLVAAASDASAACTAPSTQVCGATGATETVTVTFPTVPAGAGFSIAGISITDNSNGGQADASTTIAGLFANLANGAAVTCPNGHTICTGTLSGWTTSAVSGSSVVFTSTTPNAAVGRPPVALLGTGGSLPTFSSETVGAPAGALQTLLNNHMVCVGSPLGTAGPPWNNQEFHASGGVLTDYKKGPSDTVDPTTIVGSWAINGTGSCNVQYTYTGGGSYTYTIWNNGNGTYDFCQGASTTFTIAASKIEASGAPAACN